MASTLQHYIKLYELEQAFEKGKEDNDENWMKDIQADAIMKTETIMQVSGPSKRRDESFRHKMRASDESILAFVNINHKIEKTKHLDKFHTFGIEDRTGACKSCHQHNTFVVHTRLASKVCSNCGEVDTYQDQDVQFLDALWSDTTSSKQQSFSYKRSNHMLSWILRIQGKETNNLTPKQLECIQSEFAKMQLDSSDHNIVTIDRLRAVLKTAKMPKLYSHVHSIRYQLTGFAPPQMSEEQEHQIMSMFNDITKLYDIVQKKALIERSNMLSYSIVLSKILELLGYETFLTSLRLLKHRDRLVEQEGIWKLICDESAKHDDMPTFVFTQTPVF